MSSFCSVHLYLLAPITSFLYLTLSTRAVLIFFAHPLLHFIFIYLSIAFSCLLYLHNHPYVTCSHLSLSITSSSSVHSLIHSFLFLLSAVSLVYLSVSHLLSCINFILLQDVSRFISFFIPLHHPLFISFHSYLPLFFCSLLR